MSSSQGLEESGHLYTTGQVQRLLGVPDSTLLEWERQGYLPSNRRPHKHRRYTWDDVKHILRVRLLTRRYRFRQQVLAALERGEASDIELPAGPTEITASAQNDLLGRRWMVELAPPNDPIFAARRGQSASDSDRELRESEAKYRSLLDAAPFGVGLSKSLRLTNASQTLIDMAGQLHKSERRFRDLLENLNLAGVVLDTTGAIIFCNRRLSELSGWSREELLGSNWFEKMIPDEIRETVRISFLDTVRNNRPSLSYGSRDVVLRSGERRVISWSNTILRDADDQVVGVASTGEDLTDRQRASDDLQRARDALHVFERLVDSSLDMIAVIDRHYRFCIVNAAYANYRGRPAQSLIGEAVADAIAGREVLVDGLSSSLERAFAGERVTHESWSVRPSLGRRCIEASYYPLYTGDQVEYVVETMRDITERKQAEVALTYLTFHDALTDLYNYTYFQQELKRLEGGRFYPLSIVICDVNGLKLINDTMGHVRGDDTLRAFSRLLNTSFRRSDIVARVGGDEFSVILPNSNAVVAQAVCRRLQDAVDVYNRDHGDLPISVSVGSATAPDPEVPLQAVYRRADEAMYRDKMLYSGRGLQGVVRALLKTLAAKGDLPEGHLARLQERARSLGKHLGLSSRELAELDLLAEVQDLGKVGIPDDILLKVGPLTPDELSQLKQHCALGFRMAKASPELSHVAELVLHHHEWWNGQGYPDGLSGEEIPIACRVLAIVDDYEAMTAGLEHRPPMSHEEALAELQRGAGTQFDPQLVEEFVSRQLAG